MIIRTVVCDNVRCAKQYGEKEGFSLWGDYNTTGSLELHLTHTLQTDKEWKHYCGKKCLIEALSELVDQVK